MFVVETAFFPLIAHLTDVGREGEIIGFGKRP